MSWTAKLASYFGYSKVGNRETFYPIQQGHSWAWGPVTPEQALRVAAVMACVRLLSRTVASVPLNVYEALPDGGRIKSRDHRLWRILHSAPNSWQSSFDFRAMMQTHLCLRGNAYARIVSDMTGRPRELIPIHPDLITIERNSLTGRLQYTESNPSGGAGITYQQDDILHIRNISLDGVRGLSPIAFAAESMGISLATDRFGASFFKNGASIGNILESEKSLGETAVNRLKKALGQFTGSSNAHKTLVLEDAMKWKRMGLPPNEAQFLETRKFNVSEIARIFGVPPHKIGDLEKATFSNIEEQGIEFVQDGVQPWVVSWEQSLTRDLFMEDEPYYPRFLLDALWRGKLEDRTKALSIQFQNGVLNQDEWREIEERNAIPNGEGQKFFVPLNLSGDPKESGTPSNVIGAWATDISDRIVQYETRELPRAKTFQSFLEKHDRYVCGIIGPLMATCDKDHITKITTAGLIGGQVKENQYIDLETRSQQIKQTILSQVN